MNEDAIARITEGELDAIYRRLHTLERIVGALLEGKIDQQPIDMWLAYAPEAQECPGETIEYGNEIVQNLRECRLER